ncbi:MAG TPA: SAM-dependent methyltransferase [Actinomycetes bacterium]
MPEPLDPALAALRPLLLDPDRLVRAVAAGRRRGHEPSWRRAELRPVDLKTGRHLQVVTLGDQGAVQTTNHPYDGSAARSVDALLADSFGNWHVQTTEETVQLRVTKKGAAQVHREAAARTQATAHDRASRHLVDPGDPLFAALGAGADKRRQVDAFLRVLDGAIREAALPADRPLRVVDLGCGNAYLTFAAYHLLSRDREVELVGVDVRPAARERNSRVAAGLGWDGRVRFVEGTILGAPVEAADVVLALHACDTATDDALAQGVRWRAPLVLAAPCCHHDLQRQLKATRPPSPYGLLTREPILRERFGDVLTDALRAALLQRHGYHVDVVEFVASRHTPRNTMIKAVRGEGEPRGGSGEYDELVAAWGVTPYLQRLLDDART